MKRITIDLSSVGCEQAIKEIEDYKKDLLPKLDKICMMLAEIGVQEAQAHLPSGNEGNSATVDPPVKIGNGYKIVMSGQDVYFIEFGTGDSASNHGEFTPLVDVYPGSYSEKHSKRYSTYGFWWYNKVKYTETPAYMPMYYAEKKIRQELPRIAHEVFSK